MPGERRGTEKLQPHTGTAIPSATGTALVLAQVSWIQNPQADISLPLGTVHRCCRSISSGFPTRKSSERSSITERGPMSSAVNETSLPNTGSTSGPSPHVFEQGYHFNAPLDSGSNAFWQPPGGAPQYGMADGSLLNWDPNLENFILDFSSDEVPLALGYKDGQ
ncbi:hypothetical protein QBC45DRAFT_396036 [Copromyces sp. CBS 386.78]|nr:hypothetical protein QBC45DRAFT_396036 [Copromyces sp. CBS 386.78]